MATLEIKNLHVTVDTEQGTKEILKGVDLVIKRGQTVLVNQLLLTQLLVTQSTP
jgi:Fe-S cluster assembly ATPase SufC